MKYETRLEMLKLSDIVAAPYNPREDIERGSDEYKALRRSIELNGMVEPPVVNLHNMRCIGGNQRLVVLRDLGWKEVLCSVIDQPDESKEMKLCLALNRIEGRWDTDRLGDLLRDDEVLEFETGFDRDEVLVYRQLGGDGEGEDADDDPDWDQDEDPDGENADGEEEDEPAGSDDEPTMGTTVVRIGHLHFKVDYFGLLSVVFFLVAYTTWVLWLRLFVIKVCRSAKLSVNGSVPAATSYFLLLPGSV